MKSKLYFIGNVFNSNDESKNSREPRGFSFTNDQKADLSLIGLPIRVEHNDKLRVGTIRKSWYNPKSNKRWIIGDIERNDLKGHFAAKGVENLLYGGLSLQHLSVPLHDGTNVMIPIEVSIVEKPRRDDCNIVNFKASAKSESFNYLGLGRGESKTYKVLEFIMPSTESEMVRNVETGGTGGTAGTGGTGGTAGSAAVATAVATAGSTADRDVSIHEASGKEYEPNVTDLSKMVLELLNDKDSLEKRFAEQASELQKIMIQQASAEEEKTENSRLRAQTSKKSIIEWCAQNGVMLTKETEEQLEVLSNDHPELGNVAFEITHRASEKCARLEKLLAEKDEAKVSEELRNKVTKAYNDRMQCQGPSVTRSSRGAVEASVYEASNKRKFQSPSDVYKETNAPLLQALKRAKGNTTRDTMGKIYERLKGRF